MPDDGTHNSDHRTSTSTEEVPEEVPLADLADQLDDIEWTEERSNITDDSFTEVDIETIDRDTIWAELEGTVEESFSTPSEPEERVIPKRQFCHRCRYFTEPPEMACTHDGTKIIEMTDMTHLRVRNCPIVLERERTGKPW